MRNARDVRVIAERLGVTRFVTARRASRALTSRAESTGNRGR